MKLVYQYMAIFFNFSSTWSHLHPLQVENRGSNSWLVVDDDDYGKFKIERVENDDIIFNVWTEKQKNMFIYAFQMLTKIF